MGAIGVVVGGVVVVVVVVAVRVAGEGGAVVGCSGGGCWDWGGLVCCWEMVGRSVWSNRVGVGVVEGGERQRRSVWLRRRGIPSRSGW